MWEKIEIDQKCEKEMIYCGTMGENKREKREAVGEGG